LSPRISVIIPHLNQHDALRRCLQSLVAQTWREEFEIIVVDNGSDAPPDAIVSAFPGAQLLQEQEPGPGPARNRGIAASRGGVLAFIDADCVADDGWLLTIAGRSDNGQPKRILGGDVRIAIADSTRLTQLEAYESVFSYRQKDYITKQGFSGTGNLAVRREDFDVIGPFAGIEVAEDRDWGKRATKLGYVIEYVPDMVVYHPARVSISELFEKWERHIDHDFSECLNAPFGRIRWALYAIAIAASPAIELPRILRSTRISTIRDRCLAALAMVRIRFFRVRRMIAVAAASNHSQQSQSWNRR
jgi:glycosyltransferase involved in cell wall biosynthesis